MIKKDVNELLIENLSPVVESYGYKLENHPDCQPDSAFSSDTHVYVGVIRDYDIGVAIILQSLGTILIGKEMQDAGVKLYPGVLASRGAGIIKGLTIASQHGLLHHFQNDTVNSYYSKPYQVYRKNLISFIDHAIGEISIINRNSQPVTTSSGINITFSTAFDNKDIYDLELLDNVEHKVNLKTDNITNALKINNVELFMILRNPLIGSSLTSDDNRKYGSYYLNIVDLIGEITDVRLEENKDITIYYKKYNSDKGNNCDNLNIVELMVVAMDNTNSNFQLLYPVLTEEIKIAEGEHHE